jgi:hypothetical protein
MQQYCINAGRRHLAGSDRDQQRKVRFDMTRAIHIGQHPSSRTHATQVRSPAGPAFADACRQVIQQAYDSGADVNVYLRSVWDTNFMGRVLALGPHAFELFHSGNDIGMRWTMPFDDVAACALVTRLAGDMPDQTAARPPNDPPAEFLS